MYDLIVIGAGPAGMTAALYAARKKLKTLLVSKDMGGQMVWSADIENYTGFSMITGADLTLKFQEHLESVRQDLDIKTGVEVVDIERNIISFEVSDKAGMSYYAKSIIIASGKIPKHLGIPGEDKFYGKGVAVCATCDAPLYKGRDVVVIGGGNSAMDAIVALAKVAKTVYSVNTNDALFGEDIVKDKVLRLPNVESLNTTKVLEILGDKLVTGIV
jgi:alkyl hydroperoxide reductase subunit F